MDPVGRPEAGKPGVDPGHDFNEGCEADQQNREPEDRGDPAVTEQQRPQGNSSEQEADRRRVVDGRQVAREADHPLSLQVPSDDAEHADSDLESRGERLEDVGRADQQAAEAAGADVGEGRWVVGGHGCCRCVADDS